MARKLSQYVASLLRECGIGEESLVIQKWHARSKTLGLFNEILGKNARYSGLDKVPVTQDILYIPERHRGESFVWGQQRVELAMGQTSSAVHVVGWRKNSQGRISKFDVVINWQNIAMVGSLAQNLERRELLIDKLIEVLSRRKEV